MEDATSTEIDQIDQIDQAWREYMAENGYATYPVSPDTGADFCAGFLAGLRASKRESS